MFDFGDELIIDSYKIPWIIWIQLLVTILFIILLFGISVCTSGSAASSASTSISASTSTGRAAIAPPPPNLNNPSSSQRAKEEEIQRVEGNGEASGGMIIEDDQDRNESSLNDSIPAPRAQATKSIGNKTDEHICCCPLKMMMRRWRSTKSSF
ncbi:unnamed protein product [Fraxinus pennsylvanica]|uniref:Uncharacterized protein n=1 Tax=Fraxinus pennsylvanica TaxID=56036 RepID=A0AAD2DN50_9LAMI|nr:unnamed protein product [Fraxinus pennsylvanica]